MNDISCQLVVHEGDIVPWNLQICARWHDMGLMYELGEQLNVRMRKAKQSGASR